MRRRSAEGVTLPKFIEGIADRMAMPPGKRDVQAFDDQLPGFGIRKFADGKPSKEYRGVGQAEPPTSQVPRWSAATPQDARQGHPRLPRAANEPLRSSHRRGG